ncbi:HPr-rel-A system PqqD family peptide chaperone [Sphingomonas sp. STIS6.2]|uniref:HPr-rel-A system PqqD family peptide chaperone n=1 Tax=Sphingomonas sp. STIS6.2 TaxID=1379700 RepID=UPI0005B859A6|nr:HPr-rel-A system PqqD family peptide chaperone [Sphingomonas sp. STIS6.2]
MDNAAPGPIYRADQPGGLVLAPLDAFTVVYHRRSGMTHLLTEPAPQILAILGDAGLSLDALLYRLAGDFDLADATRPALAARLDELVAAGLVATS